MSCYLEEKSVEARMRQIGAFKGSHSDNCESCCQYVDTSQSGSKYFGGCRKHQIKVFSNHACNSFER